MLAVKVLAFDTGGTILDWHSGLVAALNECGARRGVERRWYEFANKYRRRALRRMVGAVDPAFNIDDVLQALRGRRRPVTAAALARELEVSERTIYRDLSELTSQGAPIQGEAGVGYILGPGLFLPPLMLTEDETEAILLGLRYVDQRGDEVLTNAGRSARAKITSILSRELQATVEAP
jgi:biotin operon repressor